LNKVEERMEINTKKLKKKGEKIERERIEKFQGGDKRRGGMKIYRKSLEWKIVKGQQNEIEPATRTNGNIRPGSSVMFVQVHEVGWRFAK